MAKQLRKIKKQVKKLLDTSSSDNSSSSEKSTSKSSKSKKKGKDKKKKKDKKHEESKGEKKNDKIGKNDKKDQIERKKTVTDDELKDVINSDLIMTQEVANTGVVIDDHISVITEQNKHIETDHQTKETEKSQNKDSILLAEIIEKPVEIKEEQIKSTLIEENHQNKPQEVTIKTNLSNQSQINVQNSALPPLDKVLNDVKKINGSNKKEQSTSNTNTEHFRRESLEPIEAKQTQIQPSNKTSVLKTDSATVKINHP